MDDPVLFHAIFTDDVGVFAHLSHQTARDIATQIRPIAEKSRR